MAEPFIGGEAVANGEVVRSALRTQYTRLFRDVYVRPGTELTAQVRARAGWLRSKRRGIIAGVSASALHDAKWVDAAAPLEIIHTNRNPVPGLRVHGGRIEEDETDLVDGIPVTTPARTALDLACWYPTAEAVAAIDALARAVDVKAADVELFDAKQHRNDRRQYTWDIRRREMLERRGWTIVRVVAGDQPADIIRRVKATLARRVSR